MKQHGSIFVAAAADGKHSAAIKALDVEIKEAGNSKDTHLARLLHNRGICHQKLHLYRKALKDFDDALAINPGSIEALYRKGQVLVGLKREQDAVSVWGQALNTCTSTTDAQLVMDIGAALRDPSSVLLQSDLASYAWAQLTSNWSLTAFGLAFLLITCLLVDHSFKVATSMSLAPSIYHAPPAPVTSTPVTSAVPQPVSPSPAPPKPSTQTPTTSTSTTASSAQTAAPCPRTPTTPAAATPQPQQASKAASSKDDASCAPEDINCAAQQEQTKAARAAARGVAASDTSVSPNAASNSVAIQVAVTQINAGQVKQAEELLDRVLSSSPKELGARVARGTARALRRDLKGAVEDFSVAIEVEPRYADTWKRRGQARAALGETDAALADLQKAIDLLPMWAQDSGASRAECYVEKGMLYQKARDYRRACRELKEAVKLDARNPQAWNVLGLCSVSQGDIRDGVAAYRKAVALKPDLKEAWFNMAQALKEEGSIKEAEEAFEGVMALDAPDSPSVHALRVIAQMRQQAGEHARAIEVLDRAIGYGKDDQMVELLYLRAICHHALGNVREAVSDYESCLSYQRPSTSTAPPLNEEARAFQYLSFYQKEMVLYMYHSLDRQAASFCPDAELLAVFKELWCKKGPPTPELIAQFTPQLPAPVSPPLPPPRPDTEKLAQLIALADRFGVLLQNDHQGFYPNARQQRAAGFAAMELAQAVRALVASRRAGNTVWVSSEGSSVQAGTSGRHQFGWRDAMDIVVKWRQLAEPNDQVVWVDLLTRREFEQGFGSHTPIFSGQTKCVRYYMNFKRAQELQRQVLLREGHAFDAQNRQVPCGSPDQQDAIRQARTAEDMYQVLRQDSWVVVPISSVSRPGHSLEGTRLTLVKVPNQPDAYEFSIRTPVTPPRWRDFDVELEAAWESIISEMSQDSPSPVVLARAILTYGYYWYNFMPLARGTAACGYTTILSIFWAAGMPVTARIPKSYQVDWEAILAQHPDHFTDALSKWMYPAAVRDAQAGLPAAASQAAASSTGLAAPSDSSFPDISTLPPMSDFVGTIRHRLEALNGPGSKRVV